MIRHGNFKFNSSKSLNSGKNLISLKSKNKVSSSMFKH